MAKIAIDGVGIAYELLGKEGDPAVALTPGGRFSLDAPGLRELANDLVARMPRGRMTIVPNSHHHVLLDNPTGLIAALDEFVNGLE